MPSKPKFKIKADLADLEKTTRGKHICPLCGVTGYGEWWWSLHRVKPHTQCHCGRVVLTSGLRRHQLMKGCI